MVSVEEGGEGGKGWVCGEGGGEGREGAEVEGLVQG